MQKKYIYNRRVLIEKESFYRVIKINFQRIFSSDKEDDIHCNFWYCNMPLNGNRPEQALVDYVVRECIEGIEDRYIAAYDPSELFIIRAKYDYDKNTAVPCSNMGNPILKRHCDIIGTLKWNKQEVEFY